PGTGQDAPPRTSTTADRFGLRGRFGCPLRTPGAVGRDHRCDYGQLRDVEDLTDIADPAWPLVA
ncbi:hypothetical protein, partial [Streptodolium elevatio]